MPLTVDFFFLDTYNIYCAVVVVKFSAARVCRVLFGVSHLCLCVVCGILVIVHKGHNNKVR